MAEFTVNTSRFEPYRTSTSSAEEKLMPTEELFGAYHYLLEVAGGPVDDSFGCLPAEDGAAGDHVEGYEVKWGTRVATAEPASSTTDGGGLRSDGDLVQGGAADGLDGKSGLIDVIALSSKVTGAADLVETRAPDDGGLGAGGAADLSGDFIL